jgi:hypothetical protein
VVGAAFWLWLWGPIGLLLSTPLIVCLVVLGKYVPALAFFDALLGDTPPLTPADRYYQRLLAGHQHEATRLIQDLLKDHAPEEVYDRVLLPALVRARADVEREEIGEEEERRVVRTTREVVEDVLARIGRVGPGARRRRRGPRRRRSAQGRFEVLFAEAANELAADDPAVGAGRAARDTGEAFHRSDFRQALELDE